MAEMITEPERVRSQRNNQKTRKWTTSISGFGFIQNIAHRRFLVTGEQRLNKTKQKQRSQSF